MPFSTELPAVKLDWTTDGVNVKLPVEESRESNATSEGELTRVSTFPDGGTVESLGNTRYISTTTSLMLEREAPVGSRPTNEPPVTFVAPVSTKSSAASISILPTLSGRDAMAINPSGLPVLTR